MPIIILDYKALVNTRNGSSIRRKAEQSKTENSVKHTIQKDKKIAMLKRQNIF